MRRVPAIVVLVAYLLFGSLGGSARTIVCTDADGQVHLERPLNSCCDHHGADSEIALELASSAEFSATDGCGPCTDELIHLGSEYASSRQRDKAESQHQLHCLVASIAYALIGEVAPTTSVTGVSKWPIVAAHAPIETVIFRC